MSEAASRIGRVWVEEAEYINGKGQPLAATVYRPDGPGPFPMVLEVHGGAWCRGSRQDEHSMNQALCGQGIVVAALDFRMPPQASYPGSLCDINAALRYFKGDADQWQSRPDAIGIMGVSSGGHQAVLAALRARDPRYLATPVPGAGPADARAAFIVACWPVIDPLGRYRHAKAMQRSGSPYPAALDRVVPDHEKYWLTEDAMREGAPAVALEGGEALDLPPLLCVQGEDDIVHPRAHLDRFVAAYRAAGGEAAVRLYPGQAEGFITRNPEAAASTAAIREIGTFIKRCGAAT
ncbi:alpha/beta hydrolase [Bordetella petrii]|uniref:alpha/beta hydrolase n=1 Tax=Bordetella petrii TaxID=94624 RepID=UPI001E5AF353|nr:alpha/beta hydrolase [Bordetella petrii]MCD0502705.1 alpha/beta hydrolase [Bordetella petrii]